MKVNISVDLTPEEFRKSMGWPDIQPLQEEMLAKIREQMEAGSEGYDPISLMQPFLSPSTNSVESFQKIMMGMMNDYFSGKSTSSDK